MFETFTTLQAGRFGDSLSSRLLSKVLAEYHQSHTLSTKRELEAWSGMVAVDTGRHTPDESGSETSVVVARIATCKPHGAVGSVLVVTKSVRTAR